MDECQLQPALATSGGTCFNTLGGHSCVCVMAGRGRELRSEILMTVPQLCASAGPLAADRVAPLFTVPYPMGKTGIDFFSLKAAESH